MGKVSKKTETPKIVEAQIEVTVETPTQVETQIKYVGRKIDPTSKRQIELAKKAEAKANGTFKKGRPIIGTSKRQETLAKRQSKIEAHGSLKKGRPSNETSKRQIALTAKAAKLAEGIEVKRGRPKVEKVEAVTTDIVELEKGEVIVEKAVKAKRKKQGQVRGKWLGRHCPSTYI